MDGNYTAAATSSLQRGTDRPALEMGFRPSPATHWTAATRTWRGVASRRDQDRRRRARARFYWRVDRHEPVRRSRLQRALHCIRRLHAARRALFEQRGGAACERRSDRPSGTRALTLSRIIDDLRQEQPDPYAPPEPGDGTIDYTSRDTLDLQNDVKIARPAVEQTRDLRRASSRRNRRIHCPSAAAMRSAPIPRPTTCRISSKPEPIACCWPAATIITRHSATTRPGTPSTATP